MKQGWIVWAVLVVIMAILTYIYTGFNIHHVSKTTTTIKKLTTSIIYNTTTSASTTFYTTANYTPLENCSEVNLMSNIPYAKMTQLCSSEGVQKLGLWVAAGDNAKSRIIIEGYNNITYVNTTFTYSCMTFLQNVTLPKQDYKVILESGPGGGQCGTTIAKMNLSTSIPPTIYSYIYNANFTTGLYTGWQDSTNAFGPAPLNISYADSKQCYLGTPWSNYPGGFFATTYNCGLSVSDGNLTSSYFMVNPNEPYLNFKIISPQDNNLYIEILQANYKSYKYGNSTVYVFFNSTPSIIAHFNTYNITANPNAQSHFMNATIPLTTLANKAVAIRIVAQTLNQQSFIAAGEFNLGSLPTEQAGVEKNITYT